MSDYRAIADVGETLVDLLKNNMEGMTDNSIVLASPGDIETEGDVSLSLFLYQIVENIHMKTQEMLIKDNTTLRFPPVALDLYYMMTSHITLSNSTLTKRTKQAHETLGRAIQILNDNQTLPGSVLKGSLHGSSDEIHIILTSMSLDEMSKIWTTFQGKPFRTSVCYMVTPVIIDSTHEMQTTRVVSKEMNYYQMIPNRG